MNLTHTGDFGLDVVLQFQVVLSMDRRGSRAVGTDYGWRGRVGGKTKKSCEYASTCKTFSGGPVEVGE